MTPFSFVSVGFGSEGVNGLIGVVGDLSQNVAQVILGIKAMPFAALDESE